MDNEVAPVSHHGRSEQDFKRAGLGKVAISAILVIIYYAYAYFGGHTADQYMALIMGTVPVLGLIMFTTSGHQIEQSEILGFCLKSYALLGILAGSIWIPNQTESFQIRTVFLYATLFFAYITDFLYVHRYRFPIFILLGCAGAFLLPVEFSTQLMLTLALFFMSALGYDTVRLRESNARMTRELEDSSERKIFQLSHFDPLTSLPNHLMLIEIGQEFETDDLWDTQAMAVFSIGLDGFKAVNDSMGHTIGDRVLRIVADRISEVTDTDDILSRYSGDQFTLVIPNFQSAKLLEMRAKQILWSLSQPMEVEGERLMLTCSIGIALKNPITHSFTVLLQSAETAMNEAKIRGRNRHHLFDETLVRATQDRLRIESALRIAVSELQGFHLVYQPKLDLKTGKVSGAEALIRWRDPNLGTVRPDQFIYIAESTGLIVPLGYWIFRSAISDFEQLEKEGLNLPSMSINLSATQFQDPALIETLLDTLENCSLDPAKLDIELTESAMMDRPDEGRRILERLKATRMTLSIDDFGIAYSSLGYLKRLPADRLKIDRSFITEITAQEADQSITSSIIVMGHKLGLKVLAEGVETEEQLQLLKTLDCDEIQGFYFARPLPFEEFSAFLKKHL